MKKTIILGFAILLSILAEAQTIRSSRLFADYRYDKSSSMLPDFSYVGYHRGEDTIPKVNYTVFNVVNYGAVANDTLSDRAAIEAAIAAAKANGSGIVFFPPGRFRVNEPGDSDTQSIVIDASNIVLRGSGSGAGGTELFMRRTMLPTNPAETWTVPKMFVTKSSKSNGYSLGTISLAAKEGDFNITLTNKGSLMPGDWILLSMNSAQPSNLNLEFGNKTPSPDWSITTQGVKLRIYHRIKSISGNTLTLYEPITYPISPVDAWYVFKAGAISEVGIEDIAFVGNWKDNFVHHKDWIHNSGWSMLAMSNTFDSWVRNCRFTDVNVAAGVNSGANITIKDCTITGNDGHSAITNNGGTNILFSNIVDYASQWHSVGISGPAMNTVLHRVTYPATTCFEAHAAQPRNTLLDNVQGGLYNSRGGGAIVNMPNHLRNLVFWNYKQTNAPYTNFEFWPATFQWWKIPDPIIAGFTGGTSFNSSQIRLGSEAVGLSVYPSSLYEAQFNERKRDSTWSSSINWRYTFGKQTATFNNTDGTIGVSSFSNSTTNGFLPIPDGANAGVYIRSSGNALFELDGKHGLSLNTSTLGTLSRFSVNNISEASSVARFSFHIDFSPSGLADAGNYVFAVGNNKNKLFVPSYGSSVYRASDELFTALRWTPNTSGTSTAIDFAYRQGSDLTSITNYTLINNTVFLKGGKYYVEVYCNNSGASKTYKKSKTTYLLPNDTFHLWVNGVKLGGDYPRSIEVNGSTGLNSGNSIALANGAALNSFLVSSNNGTSSSSGKILMYYPEVSYLDTNASTSSNVLPVSLISFDAYRKDNQNQLHWITASELNNKKFEIYRSINDDNFKMISSINGAGNSSQKRYYNFTDKEFYTGIAYYKLKQIDQNGTVYSFKDLKAIKSDFIAEKLTVFKASDDLICFTYLSQRSRKANLSIYDVKGKKIYSSEIYLNQGLNKMQINGTSISKGVYVAVINEGDIIERKKFIK